MSRITFVTATALVAAPFALTADAAPAPALAGSRAELARHAADWLAATTPRVSARDAALLTRAQSTLMGNLVECAGWKPYRGIMPALGTYRGVWNWDSAFHAIALAHWDPDFAHEQFAILFDKQLPNGMLPDVIWENGSMVTSFTKPPVMAWAVAVVDRRAPNDERLRALYPKLVKLGEFWENERGGKTDGLFYYAGAHAGNESGWDDSIRWDGGYQKSRSDDLRLWAIDLNCYMVSHYRALAHIAGRLGKPDDRSRWNTAADDLAARINERLWDAGLGSYVDRDRKTGNARPVLTPACFMPLFLHLAPADRAAAMVRLAADPRKFHPGMPTAAYDTPGYNATRMWRGPAWLNTAYFATKGLRDHGAVALADGMKETLLGWVAQNTDSIREYYHPKTGLGLAAKDFGWSAAFTISFILDWDNDHLTWLFPPAPALPAAASAPADDARGVYFAKKTYAPEPTPTYEQVKDSLPEPVLPAKPEYVAMYHKCWQLAFAHLRQPLPERNGFVSNYLDEAFNPNIFQWDTIFMVMFARYGHHRFPAIQSLDNFYAKQHASGFICREIRETTGKDHHAVTSAEAINPPLFSWAEMESFRVTGDKSRFAAVLPVLEHYVAWLETGRKKTGTDHGLYWSNGLGSGMDNTPRTGSGWTDMSAQMVIQYRDLAAMCEVLGMPGKAKTYRDRAAEIAARINRWMWCEEDGLYYDVDDRGRHIKWKTSGCFWPMLADITTEAQERKLIANLRDPKSFWRDNVFPTLAADQRCYDGAGRYWLGGVWAPTNYAIIRGLRRRGHAAFAREATVRYLDAMAKVFKTTGTVWELYAPDMPLPGSDAAGKLGHGHGARADFVGWSGCGPIALLIENILGFEADGANATLRWDLVRAEPHGIKKLRFGQTSADVLYDGKNTVTVHADAPFTLIINGVAHAVAAGATTLTGIRVSD